MEEAACPSTHMYAYMHTHAGSPSSKRSYGHAAMHRMRWAREQPARRNVAEAMSSTCRKEVSTFEMTASASLTAWCNLGGEWLLVLALLAWKQLLNGKQWGVLQNEKGVQTLMVSHVLGLKHGLAAQEIKNFKASTLLVIILCIYTEQHVTAS